MSWVNVLIIDGYEIVVICCDTVRASGGSGHGLIGQCRGILFERKVELGKPKHIVLSIRGR